MFQSISQRLRQINRFDAFALGFIFVLALVPLFVSFPYRVNIFLSWEGAYRMYLDQTPFKDFGLPMGYGYWIIPSLFFKLFGPFFTSLIKAQSFINMLSGLAFYSIMGSFGLKPAKRALAVIIYVISYSFFNFWPWYNHSVIVFQFVGFALLLKGLIGTSRWKNLMLIAAAFFLFLSFFTKQDGGGMGLLIASALLITHALYEKSLKSLLFFYGGYALMACLFILPLLEHGFGYWFNYGQEPHNSRLALRDFLDIILGESQWIKFYIVLIGFLIIKRLMDWKAYLADRNTVLFSLFTLGIMVEALLFQVTSYTPPDNNIFFHSFAFAFLLSQLPLNIDFKRLQVFVPAFLLIMLWWSGTYWKYIDRIMKRAFPSYAQEDTSKISVKTFMVSTDTSNVKMDKWVFCGLPSFNKVYMPESTADGIKRLLDRPELKRNTPPKVLNMTELTPLAYEMGYELEKGLPLWYHVGVGMFDKEADFFAKRIADGYYDIVLFETIPYLNNFFPENVREAAQKHYKLSDRFLAPRRPTDSHIEVYVKPQNEE